MKKKKTSIIITALIVVLVLVVPIPMKGSADGSVKTYQSLTYKVITVNDGESSETSAFFFPNNFKSTDWLLSDEGKDSGDGVTERGGGSGSSEESNGPDSSSGTSGDGSQISGDGGCGDDLSDELEEITEKELDEMYKLPETEFQGRIFGCTFDGKEALRATIIHNMDELDHFINGPKSKYFGDRETQKNDAFLNYAKTLDANFFENRALIVKYYRSQDGRTPTIDAAAVANETIVVGVSLKKPKDGETDFTGCILAVDINKEHLQGVKSCKFLMMPVIPEVGKVPLGGK